MPYPVYPVQNQTAQQLANIGSNLGIAMFGDANSMMRRKQLDQDLQFKQKQLDLQRQELGMKRGVYDSQASMNNAHAGYYGAQTAGQDFQNQQLQSKIGANSELADIISHPIYKNGVAYVDPQRAGAALSAYIRANPGKEQEVSKFLALFQNSGLSVTEDQKDAKPIIVPANTQGIITAPGSIYAQGAKDLAAATDSSGNPASVLPDGRTNPYYTPDGAPLPASDPNGFTSPAPAAPAPQAQTQAPVAPAAPSVADAFSAPSLQQQAQRPRSVGNAVVLPQNQKGQQWGTASSRAKSADKYGEAADIAGSVAAKANGLIDSASQLHMSGGGIPGVEQVAKFMISADPKQAGRADLINQFQSILTGDWLNKSTVLKGAITEREGAELRKDQPSLGASSEAIKSWLEKVGYLSQMDAEFNQFNMKRSESGLPPIGALEFKSAYASKIPPPKNLKLSYASATKGGEIQQAISPQTAPAQPASGAPAVGTVVDGYRFTGGNPADQTSWQPVQ
jgi:hypothetical protein